MGGYFPIWGPLIGLRFHGLAVLAVFSHGFAGLGDFFHAFMFFLILAGLGDFFHGFTFF